MTDLILTLVQLAAVAGPAAALVVPRWRNPVALMLLVLAGGALAAAPLSGTDGVQHLQVVHYFAAYERNEIAFHAFPVGWEKAPSWLWGVVFAGFCLIWATVCRVLRPRPHDALAQRRLGESVPAFVLPLLLAWSAIAWKLLLEKCAAPAALVAPVGWERMLFPPCFAAAILIAHRVRRVLASLLWLVVFVTVARLPVVVFGTLATIKHWGTSVDVHGTVEFANPFAQIAIAVEPGSVEQMAWLLWGPHLLVFPALYMLSLLGVAFATVMIVTHPPKPSPS